MSATYPYWITVDGRIVMRFDDLELARETADDMRAEHPSRNITVEGVGL